MIYVETSIIQWNWKRFSNKCFFFQEIWEFSLFGVLNRWKFRKKWKIAILVSQKQNFRFNIPFEFKVHLVIPSETFAAEFINENFNLKKFDFSNFWMKNMIWDKSSNEIEIWYAFVF